MTFKDFLISLPFLMNLRADHQFGCVMALLPSKTASKLIAFGASIPENEIYYGDRPEDYGRSVESHVTVKYGLHDENSERVENLVSGAGTIIAQITGVSAFDDPDKDYVVLKADIDSDGLRKLNKLIAENLPATENYPEYKPHATIAYLKKDPANPNGYRKYFTTQFNNEHFSFDKLVYSKGGVKNEMKLANKLKMARAIQRIVNSFQFFSMVNRLATQKISPSPLKSRRGRVK